MIKLFKNISIYSLGNILNKGAAFLLLPIYTRYLQPSDYGQLALVLLVGSILSIVYGLNVESGYVRIYYHKKEDAFRKELFSTGQVFNLFCALLVSIIVFINAQWVASQIFDFTKGVLYLNLILVITLVEVMTKIPLNNIRLRHKATTYVTVSLFKFLLITGCTIYFVVYASLGVTGVLYAKIIGGFITLIILYTITRGHYKMDFSVNQLKLMLGFSVFLIPPNLSSLILNMSNRYFLQEYQSLSDVGMYSLGAQISAIIPFLFTEPVKRAFAPYLFELIDDPQKCKSVLANFTRLFFVGLASVALVLSLFSREVILIMADSSFAGSHNVVFVLSTSFLILGLANIVVYGVHISRKTWIVAIVWPIAALTNIAFNIWLIPAYGRMGAAMATLLSVIIISIIYFYAVSKVYPTPFAYKKLIFAIVLMVAFNYLGSLILLAVVPSIILKMILLGVFFVTIYFFGIIKREEIRKAKEFVLNKVKK